MDHPLDEAELPGLLAAFYAKVRQDPLLGAVFNDAIDDWPHHLGVLAQFWSSVMLTSGKYKGNPVAVHLRHAERIAPEMFERWLALWRETTDERLDQAIAGAMQAKAERIGESLQLALTNRTAAQRQHQ